MKTTIRALLTIAGPDGHDEPTRERHRRTMAELLAGDLELTFGAEFVEPTRLAFAPFDVADGPELEVLRQFEREYSAYEYLEISADVSIEMDALFAKHPDFAASSPELMARFVAAQELGRAIRHLVLAANLAKPGSLEIAGGIYVFDGPFEHRTVGAMTSMVGFAVDEVAALGWPTIRDLSIGAVWRWMHRLPDFGTGCPKTRGGCALAAFSYQLKGSVAENSPIDLVWALVGLESLYGKGIEGLRAQLIEKSQTLLGKPTAHRKRFDGMYDYRSRFVHGNLDIPLAYELYTGSSASNSFEHESDKTLSTAVTVLVASLQELVLRDWAEPRFAYVVDGLSAPDT